ncbi:MAG TPA: family 10 glycosylhydrolase [Dongiaceae bacterium]|nr:family 10 glycosylhydrolase [Dongiaceae bacterium]
MFRHAKLKPLLVGLGLLLLAGFPGCAAPVTYQPADLTPPPVAREFRAAWISSVGENSWLAPIPLTTAQQKAALIAMLDQAVQLRLNAIIFQVRPACDALYASSIEPWSESLTGYMGRPPNPYYDPLEFAITEAHKRGLELHAWFNPYRARHMSAKSPIAPNHISRTRPDLVRQYGPYLWLDPGERDVQDYSLRVVMDVVKRYDIDGVHFDDYFYPYHEKDAAGRDVDFPDNASWKKYGSKSGLSRTDWRRENVNTFIQRVQSSIHAAKPWVKFGISPFGIWRPKNPPQIKGKDAYAELYADSRKWLANGWADYFSPQLYWGIAPPDQSFPVLLKWWDDQNLRGRYIWPGLDANKVGGAWTPDEIVNQLWLTRKQPGAAGAIFWGMKNLMPGPNGLAAKLTTEIYTSPALIPAFPWLSTNPPPARPALNIVPGKTSVRLSWGNSSGAAVQLWVLQRQVNGQWLTNILPGTRNSCELSGHPEVIAVTPVDRVNRTGAPAVLQLRPDGSSPAPGNSTR